MNGVRTPNRVGTCFGQADVADLALGDQLGQGTDRLLDRSSGVHPVLVVEVDVVGPKTLKRSLHGDADARGTAVGGSVLSARIRDKAELRRHHYLVTSAFDGTTDKFLAVVRAVDLGGVDVGDAQVERGVDGADRLVVVSPPPDV